MMEQMEEWEMAVVHNCSTVTQDLSVCCVGCPMLEACHGEVDVSISVAVVITPRNGKKAKRAILTLSKEK